MSDKFPETQRTFETRLLFLRSIFSHLYDKQDILASSIRHKLDMSLLNYIDTLNISTLNLKAEDPFKVLKNIDK